MGLLDAYDSCPVHFAARTIALPSESAVSHAFAIHVALVAAV